jgi:K+-transporting ATPase KdpF subunit
MERFNVGRLVHRSLYRFRTSFVGTASSRRLPDGSRIMTGMEWIEILLATGLLIYLVVALLKPEWFT